MEVNEILKKNMKDITKEEWEQLRIETEAIDREIEEHKEELDKMMEELPSDFFDKMKEELFEKIRLYEEAKSKA